jgi:predicted nucleic acid-binding protein
VVRVALDSNILIYAEGTDDLSKRDVVVPLIARIGPENLLLPMQAAGETLRWLIRKGKLDRSVAVRRIEWWFAQSEALPVSVEAFRTACGLVERHSFQVWDAIVLAASAEAEASVLLSEDMHHGFRWGGVIVINPFNLSSKELLALFPPQTLH